MFFWLAAATAPCATSATSSRNGYGRYTHTVSKTKESSTDDIRTLRMLYGDGWLLAVLNVIAPLGGWYVGGIQGAFFAETVTGSVTGVILMLKNSATREKREYWVPLEREKD